MRTRTLRRKASSTIDSVALPIEEEEEEEEEEEQKEQKEQ
jgi:hypothetical protein